MLKRVYAVLSEYYKGKDLSIELINLTEDRMRIPLVEHKNTSNGVKIDICVNNILGFINSQMLRVYSEINDIVRKMVIIIKIWAKKMEITSKSSLSSYALTLMVI